MSSPSSPKFVRLRHPPLRRHCADGRHGGIGKNWRFAGCFFLAAISSIFVTLGIVWFLFAESIPFFSQASLWKFLTSTEWAPRDPDQPQFGILALAAATITTTAIALAVAIPVGTIVALYLSEFAPHLVRETLKPALELLSAVPTVVYGYFALQFVAPDPESHHSRRAEHINMLSAGLVMGIMIIPYVSSLSEDAMRSVPMLLREGSYALGGNRSSRP